MVELIVNAFIPRREQELDLKSWRVELSLPRKQVVRAPSSSPSLQLQRGRDGKKSEKVHQNLRFFDSREDATSSRRRGIVSCFNRRRIYSLSASASESTRIPRGRRGSHGIESCPTPRPWTPLLPRLSRRVKPQTRPSWTSSPGGVPGMTTLQPATSTRGRKSSL